MSIKETVKKLVFGLTVRQEYVCVSREIFTHVFRTTIAVQGKVTPFSFEPIFVGYKPVILAIDDHEDLLKGVDICIYHHSDDFVSNSRWRGFLADSHAVARMHLTPVSIVFKNLKHLKLYQGIVGEHAFLNPMHRWSNRVRALIARERAGNVNLPGNLHDMVRIAYSMPRTIALISIQQEEKMNQFPTDLHGKVNDQFYISSLRIGGKAQQQVDQLGKIVVSEVSSKAFRSVYALGKNHMKEMSETENFDLLSTVSEKFKVPLPAHTLRYFELSVLEYLDVGIHRIYLYKIENEVEISSGNTLAHIHQYYAQWREDHAIETNYLFR